MVAIIIEISMLLLLHGVDNYNYRYYICKEGECANVEVMQNLWRMWNSKVCVVVVVVVCMLM